MFEKLKEKLASILEKVFADNEEYKRKKTEEINAERRAYMEERWKKENQKNIEAIKRKWKEKKEAEYLLKHEFTTVKQYVSIVEDSSWKKLSETEKEIVIKRAGELRKEDTNFAREYQEWLNKKNNEAKLKRKKGITIPLTLKK